MCVGFVHHISVERSSLVTTLFFYLKLYIQLLYSIYFRNYYIEKMNDLICEAKKTNELEKELNLRKDVIRRDNRHFLKIKYSDSITRRNQNGCGYRYIEMNTLKKYIPNDLILSRAEEIKGKN